MVQDNYSRVRQSGCMVESEPKALVGRGSWKDDLSVAKSVVDCPALSLLSSQPSWESLLGEACLASPPIRGSGRGSPGQSSLGTRATW